jgi:CTP:molybdopterin cytidylyltransferase MocA
VVQPIVAIFHQPPDPDTAAEAPLTHVLATARDRLVAHQVSLFEETGAVRVVMVGREPDRDESFGARLARLVAQERAEAGLVVLGSGAVPLLRRDDVAALIAVAAGRNRTALTNNRYSSDICAIGDAQALKDLPPLPSDNPLPRWLEERAGFEVRELPGRARLGLDIDGPLDLAILSLVGGTPSELRALARELGLAVPHLDAMRELAADPRRELLVFGRSGSRQLRWLERNVRCRVRFLAEERGLRASSPLAIGGEQTAVARKPRDPASTIGLLLDDRGPEQLGAIVGSFADGAILDTRVLMAQRFGRDEDGWPSPEDRYGSDLLRSEGIRDRWLAALTKSAADASIPVLLGAHTLVGPGLPIVLRGQSSRR